MPTPSPSPAAATASKIGPKPKTKSHPRKPRRKLQRTEPLGKEVLGRRKRKRAFRNETIWSWWVHGGSAGVDVDPTASRRRSLRSAALPRLGDPDSREKGNGWLRHRD